MWTILNYEACFCRKNVQEVDFSTLKVQGIEKAILKITFEKFLSLNNMLYVVDSSSLFSKHDFKIVFDDIQIYTDKEWDVHW